LIDDESFITQGKQKGKKFLAPQVFPFPFRPPENRYFFSNLIWAPGTLQQSLHPVNTPFWSRFYWHIRSSLKTRFAQNIPEALAVFFFQFQFYS